MRSSTMFKLTGALAVVLAAFFVTIKVLDYWGAPQEPKAPKPPIQSASQMQEPAYNAATLPHLSTGQSLTFASDQERTALLSGWLVDAHGPWTAARAAYLGFVVDGGANIGAPKQIIMNVSVSLVPGKLDEQRVQVWSAGKKAAERNLKSRDATISVPLDAIAVKNGSPLVLGLYLPDAKSMQELGINPDVRSIGILIKSLQLTP